MDLLQSHQSIQPLAEGSERYARDLNRSREDTEGLHPSDGGVSILHPPILGAAPEELQAGEIIHLSGDR